MWRTLPPFWLQTVRVFLSLLFPVFPTLMEPSPCCLPSPTSFANQSLLTLQVLTPHGARPPWSPRHRDPPPGHRQPTGQTRASAWNGHHAHVSPAQKNTTHLHQNRLYQPFSWEHFQVFVCSAAAVGLCWTNPLSEPCSHSLDVSR